MTDPIRVYRCEKCGKWSHAQKKPRHHQRFVRDEPSQTDVILREEPGYVDHEGNGDEGGWYIACGPFTTYEAVKVA